MGKVDARQKLEQIRKKKGKNPKTNAKAGGNVKDLRQLISKKKKVKSPENKTASGRVTKASSKAAGKNAVKDLRETNKKLASRKKTTQPKSERPIKNKSVVASRPTSVVVKRSAKNGAQLRSKIQYYVPPHLQPMMHQIQPQNQQPTYVFAPPQTQSNLAMDSVQGGGQGASVLVSNLVPSITQSEIIELFGDIGELTAVNMINQTTALVTYQRSSDALKAVRNYHNRSLDDRPMFVNMMPALTPGSSVRSRIGRAM